MPRRGSPWTPHLLKCWARRNRLSHAAFMGHARAVQDVAIEAPMDPVHKPQTTPRSRLLLSPESRQGDIVRHQRRAAGALEPFTQWHAHAARKSTGSFMRTDPRERPPKRLDTSCLSATARGVTSTQQASQGERHENGCGEKTTQITQT